MADDVTIGELVRTMRDLQADTRTGIHNLRNEMSGQIGKLDLAVDELAEAIAKGYVSVQLYEEVRRNQGERLGLLEQRTTRGEEAVNGRYEATQKRIEGVEKDMLKRFEDLAKEAKADRRLIMASLVFPFIMLIVGLVVTGALVK